MDRWSYHRERRIRRTAIGIPSPISSRFNRQSHFHSTFGSTNVYNPLSCPGRKSQHLLARNDHDNLCKLVINYAPLKCPRHQGGILNVPTAALSPLAVMAVAIACSMINP